MDLRVVVLGGYGFFGQRLVERLADRADCTIVIAGRRLAPAAALADRWRSQGARASLQPAVLDAAAPDVAAVLGGLNAHVLVHTAGPFQQQDYRVARACIAAGVHYIDLADGRDFVVGIGVLDEAARRAGVSVLSGASSVPALSAAAADALTQDLARVDTVDIGISPGNRTERGLATVRAILGYCGQSIGPASAQGHRPYGWSGRWHHRYPLPVGTRLLSPCDVPDLALLPGRYPGSPAVRFGAGLDYGMNLLAAVARRGWVKDWSAHARLLKTAADLLRSVGSDRGAMHVAVHGRTADDRPVRRLWELVARDGDGSYVPTLAAAALLRRMQAGERPPSGARPCVGLLSLDAIAVEARGLAITMAACPPDGDDDASLYQSVMCDAYDRLHPALRHFHSLRGRWTLRGQVATQPPDGRLARLLGRLLGTPLRATAGPLHFVLDAAPTEERWQRDFPDRTMCSRLGRDGTCVVERLGPTRLRFTLEADQDRLRMRLQSLHFCGLPCPRWLLPAVIAEKHGEGGADGRLHFDVQATVPGIGRVACYRGSLDLASVEARP